MALSLLGRAVICLGVAVIAAPGAAAAQTSTLETLYEFAPYPGQPTGDLVKGPDGTLYGTMFYNPPTQPGGVFSLRRAEDGSYEYRLLAAFPVSGTSGRYPFAGLVLASDGNLYGTTLEGGVNDAGTIFRITTDGDFTLLHSFDGAAGKGPMGRLVQGADGYLYGTTVYGGRFNLGTIFRVSTSGAFRVVHNFWWFTGATPVAGLLLASDGNFFGTTYNGGLVIYGPGSYTYGGTIFKMTPSGVVTPLHYFDPRGGSRPVAGLAQASDGHLYGTTSVSDAGWGTVFRISTGGVFNQLHQFPPFGGRSLTALMHATDGYLYGTVNGDPRDYDANLTHGSVFRVSLGGDVDIVHAFNILDGKTPIGGVLEGSDGALYGTTMGGGAEQHGSVYRFSDGALRTVHSFTGQVRQPQGLLRARDGNFYGVDPGTGAGLTGTFFKLTPDGVYTPLRTLLKAEGQTPSPLMQAADGNFYGTTRLGGDNGSGMVFRMTTLGALNVIASFGELDGISGFPLVQAADGTFYGTMEYGVNNKGSIFRMSPDGIISTVYAFADQFMSGIKTIILGTDGNIYGVTEHGGPNQLGTVFKLTTAGVFTTLHTFSGGPDGSRPVSRLAQATDGFLYGTTYAGGVAGFGTVFRISPTGDLTTLHSFTGSDGRAPIAPLHAAADGLIYGTSDLGSAGQALGTVFRITPSSGMVSIVHTFPADGMGAPRASGVVDGGDGALHGFTWRSGNSAFFYRLRP